MNIQKQKQQNISSDTYKTQQHIKQIHTSMQTPGNP